MIETERTIEVAKIYTDKAATKSSAKITHYGKYLRSSGDRMKIEITSDCWSGTPKLMEMKIIVDDKTIVSTPISKNEMLSLSQQFKALSEDLNKIAQIY